MDMQYKKNKPFIFWSENNKQNEKQIISCMCNDRFIIYKGLKFISISPTKDPSVAF